MNGFKQFLLRGNVVDMAVGIVVGAAFTGVITAFVKDLLTPLIAALAAKPDFSAIAFQVNGSRFMIGEFANEVVSFLIIGAVVYFLVVLPLNTLFAMQKAPAPAATSKTCPECASQIPIQARRCAFCTVPLE